MVATRRTKESGDDPTPFVTQTIVRDAAERGARGHRRCARTVYLQARVRREDGLDEAPRGVERGRRIDDEDARVALRVVARDLDDDEDEDEDDVRFECAEEDDGDEDDVTRVHRRGHQGEDDDICVYTGDICVYTEEEEDNEDDVICVHRRGGAR